MCGDARRRIAEIEDFAQAGFDTAIRQVMQEMVLF